jgi:hypothetical protein
MVPILDYDPSPAVPNIAASNRARRGDSGVTVQVVFTTTIPGCFDVAGLPDGSTV